MVSVTTARSFSRKARECQGRAGFTGLALGVRAFGLHWNIANPIGQSVYRSWCSGGRRRRRVWHSGQSRRCIQRIMDSERVWFCYIGCVPWPASACGHPWPLLAKARPVMPGGMHEEDAGPTSDRKRRSGYEFGAGFFFFSVPRQLFRCKVCAVSFDHLDGAQLIISGLCPF